MTRRRLSDQQSRRIAQKRRVGTGTEDADAASALPGRVAAQFGRQALVEDPDGRVHRCHLRANLGTLVAGDLVRWLAAEDGNVVVSREHRRTVLQRPDARGQLRPVAANIDLMLIVIAPRPEPHANLIDRYLVAAAHQGIDAALVLNKADLLDPDSPLPQLLRDYERLGYPTALTGPEDVDGAALLPLIQSRTLVLVGQSGVGKSSLIQRLLPDRHLRIGALSDAVGKGRHTTTTAELFPLPSGGQLIDSPGIREFHLHHLPASAVAAGFREFADAIGQCRFRDCDHRTAPGCGVIAAVKAGQISADRYNSYLRIVDSLND